VAKDMCEEKEIRDVRKESYAIKEATRFLLNENETTLTEKKYFENDNTMVTVVCITYGHEEYIAEALDSFLMQKTNFKFKIFVGEDCGPDRTAEIVKEYAKKYPDIIVPFLREKNMGAQHNLIDLCQRATSPYIAFCEGDDYWIDENKLQKQVEYMEENSEMRFCFHNIEIVAPEDWYFNDFYKPNSDGKRLMPDCIPGYDKNQKYFDAGSYIKHNPARTSSIFYRWNYDLDIPEWYYNHLGGDVSIAMMQLGRGKCAIIDGVMGTWRRSEVGVTYAENKDQDFLKTRIDWVGVLFDLREYFVLHYGRYACTEIENRMKLEVANYLKTLIKLDMSNEIAKFFYEYPEASKIALNAYMVFYDDSRALTNTCTWEGYKLIVRNRLYRNGLRPYVKVIKKFEKYKRVYRDKKNIIKKGKLFRKCKNFCSFFCYWLYSFVPKTKNLWVFSSFNKKGYLDNAKYLYEYVIENHPEIDAYWLTGDDKVYKTLKERNMPVCKFRTKECRRILSHAEIAVTDHYVVSDYEDMSGFNDKIKVVQLWHGVSLKSLKSILESTTIPGLRYSEDMYEVNETGVKIRNKWKYFRHAYYREKFEDYFFLLCPGQEHIEQVAKVFGVPEDRCFISGHPRNIVLHQKSKDGYPTKILYAPTFRWDKQNEKYLVDSFVEALPDIQRKMEQIDGTFVFRLHPHTWRSYQSVLKKSVKQFERIKLDEDKDIYQSLHEYTILISDYSSIAYDFVLLNRPVIFFCYDYEYFSREDTELNYDYFDYSPGAKTYNWAETLDAIDMYFEHPEKDSEWRIKVANEFYDMNLNDEYNSERIVREIKRRLEIE